jgi:RHS repeat-associated protein
VYAIPDLYLAASEVSKTKLFTGFKAAPFIEPAIGLAYFRERWYDPATGTWLTPDPMGYADSSNAYAFAKLDPVNLSDPTGELAPLVVAALGWAGGALAATAVDIGIDYALADEGQFDINASIGTNLTVNALTGGLGRLKYLQHLGRAARIGVEFGADVAVTGTADMWAYDQSAAYAYGSAAVGGAVGRGFGYGLKHATGLGGYGSTSSVSRPVFATERIPAGTVFEGNIYRAVRPKFVATTWEIPGANVGAIHRYSDAGRGAVYVRR